MLKEGVTRHWGEIALGLLTIVTAVLVVLAFQHTRGVPPTRISSALPSQPPSASANEKPAETPTPPDQKERKTDALFFGDAFTAGAVAAKPATQGFASVTASDLGWTKPVIDGEAGTGYVQAGQTGATYLQRFRELELPVQPEVVVLEGTINDQAAAPELLRTAVSQLIAEARGRYPAAEIVLFGPIVSDPSNTFAVASIQELNSVLSEVAADENAPVRRSGDRPMDHAGELRPIHQRGSGPAHHRGSCLSRASPGC
ncbi:MAG TPA: SGNH/GDSL hydrolase family protein [Nocardioidaceae bacterium]|nr:SGNH/GDSL hydrolase family protein [Nocardioidaceae bacterium]